MADIKQPVSLTSGDDTDNVNVPDMIARHKSVRATIASNRKDVPMVGNPLNTVDGRIKDLRQSDKMWDTTKPYKLEEFQSGDTPYRGQGLLPTDETVGIRVKDRPVIKS